MRRVLTAIFVALCAPALLTAQLKAPTDWKWRPDTQAPLAEGAFVQMPPGWHVTTGPGVLLYPAIHGEVDGNYSLEAEIFLFPGESTEEYGLFLGGRDIESSAAPEYVAFVLRRDGHAAIVRQGGGSPTAVSAWQRHAAILAGKPADNVKNVLRVDVDAANATLWVNGEKVVSVPRASISGDGRVGFRVGKDMNLHISSFNVTRKLAPVPVKKN
jgi:hypothetical protein